MTIKRRFNLVLAIAGVLLTTALTPMAASAQDKPVELNFGTLPFPSMTTMMVDIIIAKGFDRANGIIATPKTYGTAGAQWAAVANGELAANIIGPYTLTQIRSEGVNIAIYGTLVRLSSEQIVTRNPAIKKFEDLKGKTLAAMVGFPEYEYLQMYARKLGFELAEQITVVNATPTVARAQLEAGRVDAIMVWEPSATMILRANPEARVILTGDEMWRALTGETTWQLLNFVNLDFYKKNPAVVGKLFKAYQQAANFMNTRPDEADEIITSNKYNSHGIPKGTIADALKSGRLYWDVQPSWDPATNKRIWDIFKVGLEYKAIKALPPADSVISVAPAQ